MGELREEEREKLGTVNPFTPRFSLIASEYEPSQCQCRHIRWYATPRSALT